MVCFAFWLSSLISSSKTAQTVGYAIILVGFVFQAIMSSGNGALVDMLWADDLPPWVLFVRWVLTQYPPFNFDKAFADIAFKSSDTLNLSEGRIVKGKGFEWDDLFEGRAINFFGTHVEIPAPMQQILWLVINTAIYGLVGLVSNSCSCKSHSDTCHTVPRQCVAWRTRLTASLVLLFGPVLLGLEKGEDSHEGHGVRPNLHLLLLVRCTDLVTAMLWNTIVTLLRAVNTTKTCKKK